MKHLVLLGSGPSHLQVLRELAQSPLPAAQVTLVTPAAREVLPELLPAWVAGRRRLDDCSVPIAPLVEAARSSWLQGAVHSLDAAQRSVQLADGTALSYDVLSVDLPPDMPLDAIAGAHEHALPLRPLEPFMQRWDALHALAQQRSMSLVVVGSSALAVELAFAIHDRVGERVRVSLVTGGGALLPTLGAALRARVRHALKRHKMALFEDSCASISATQVQLGQGLRLGCDAAVLALAETGPACLAGSGLALDAAGFIATRATRQSASHVEVFAAAPGAGASLALNLRRIMAGGELVRERSQAARWRLLDCGAGSAIAAWRGITLQGRWVAARKARREQEWRAALL